MKKLILAGLAVLLLLTGILAVAAETRRSAKPPAKTPVKTAPTRPAVSEIPPLQVGPDRPYKLPSEAAAVAKDGDVVVIDARVYSGDVAVWTQNNLTLRGVGGRAHLRAWGKAAEGKAIWVIKGTNVTVENIEFSGAQAPDKDGAGIRLEGGTLTNRHGLFHDNEMGILTANKPDSELLIEGSEFYYNTVDYKRYGRLGHNIYIGEARRFTLRNSYIHDASIGHNVKSRARENYILYNRIMDERGNSSYLVDLPNGGQAFIIGNLFQQSQATDNPAMIAFAAEHNQSDPKQVLYVVNNTFVNDLADSIFVFNHSVAPAHLINNLMIGNAKVLQGPGKVQNNLTLEIANLKSAAFKNVYAYDYRLTRGSVAIDKGTDPGRAANGYELRPAFQYLHPLRSEARPQRGGLDVGAYEYKGEGRGRASSKGEKGDRPSSKGEKGDRPPSERRPKAKP
jgi:hypothetical protein